MSNNDVLSNCNVTMKEYVPETNSFQEITESISLYPDAIKHALERFNDADSVITQLIDNINDITECTVISHDIDKENLSFA